jgi:hypothetical protein
MWPAYILEKKLERLLLPPTPSPGGNVAVTAQVLLQPLLTQSLTASLHHPLTLSTYRIKRFGAGLGVQVNHAIS